MANFNPFDEREIEKKRSQSWFAQTAIKGAAFTGTAFGIYGLWKMRGPARNLLEKFLDQRMRTVFSEEVMKAGDDFDEILKTTVQASKEEILDDFAAAWDTDVKDAWKMTSPEASLVGNVDRMEDNIIVRGEQQIEHNRRGKMAAGMKVKPGTNMELYEEIVDYAKFGKLRETQDEIFARLRQSAILEYLENYGEVTGQKILDTSVQEMIDAGQYFSGEEYLGERPIKDQSTGSQLVKRVTDIHQAYMGDRRYAMIYEKRLKRLHRRTQLNAFASTRPKVKGPKPTPFSHKNFKQVLYGNVSSTAFDLSSAGTPAPDVETIALRGQNIDSIGAVTSRAGRANVGIQVLDKLQTVTYTDSIRSVARALERAVGEDKGLADYKIELESYKTSTATRKYLKISMYHKDELRFKEPIEINVPITVDGRMPGSSPTVADLADRWYKVGNVFGTNEANMEIVNTTQRMLNEISDMLQGSMMSSGMGSFRDDPKHVQRRLNQLVGRMRDTLANSTETMRDFIQMTAVEDPLMQELMMPSPTSTHHKAKSLHNFVNASTSMRRIKNLRAQSGGKKTVVINFDLESLSNKAIGVQHQPFDPETQWVKAGFAVTSLNEHGNTLVDVDEITSSHGYYHFADQDRAYGKGKGFNERLRSWLRDGVLPDGKNVVDPVEAYRLHVLEEVQKGRMKDFRGNEDFLKATVQKLRNLKKQYEASGHNVVISTKNGFQYDFIPIRKFLSASEWADISESSIDVQSLKYARKHAFYQRGSLRIERLMEALMGRLGFKEREIRGALKMDTPAGIRAILGALNKRKLGNEFQLLGLRSSVIKKMEKGGYLTRGHVSPVVDALFSSALLGEEFHSFLSGDELYEAANPLRRTLEAGKRINSADELIEMMSSLDQKAIPGYGVTSFSAVSAGMASKLRASLTHLGDLLPFPDVPLNKAFNQMYATEGVISPSKHFISSAEREFKGNKLAFERHLKRNFSPLITTDTSDAMANLWKIRAGDMAAMASHTVRAKTVYLWGAHMGAEGYVGLTDRFLKNWGVTHDWNIPLTDFENDPNVNKGVLEFREALTKRARELAPGRNINSIGSEVWEQAANDVLKDRTWGLKLNTQLLSANKFGGQVGFEKRQVHGEIRNVMVDRTRLGTKTGVEKLVLKLRTRAEGLDIAGHAAQVRLLGDKAVLSRAKTFADATVQGILGHADVDIISSAKFMDKGYVGTMKHTLMSTLLDDVYDKLNSKTLDPDTRAALEGVVEDIRTKMNADVDIENWKFSLRRGSKGPRDIEKASGAAKRLAEYTGDIDVRLSQIHRWYVDAGVTWSKQEMSDMHRGGFDPEKHWSIYRDALDKKLADIDREINSASSTLADLSPEKRSYVADEIKATRMLLNVAEGQPKFFQPFLVGPNQILPGLVGIEAPAFTGFHYRNPQVIESHFRRDYLLAIKNSKSHVSKSTIDYIQRHFLSDRRDQFKSVKKTFQRFRDVLLGKAMVKHELNLEQLKLLIDREGNLDLNSIKQGMGGDRTWGTASIGKLASVRDDLEKLKDMEHIMKDAASLKKVESELAAVNEALEKKGARELFDTLGTKRFYHQEQLNFFQEAAERNGGIVAIDMKFSQGNDVYKMPLEQMIKQSYGHLEGAAHLSEQEIDNLGRKVVDTLNEITTAARKDKNTPLFEFVDGELKMKQLVLPWDPMQVNEFDKIRPDTWMSTPETEMKLQIFRAAQHYQEALQVKGPRDPHLRREDIDNKKAVLDKAIFRWLMIGMNADKQSKIWQSAQGDIPGLFLQHKGVESLQTTALHLMESGKAGDHRKVLEKLVKSDMNTIFIRQSLARDMPALDQAGNMVRYMDMVKNKLRDSSPEYIRAVSEGLDTLPGGIFYRFPITQAGADGILDFQMGVIPDNIADMIGMDGNSFYAHTILSGLQKWDSDGDQGFLHMKELSTVHQFNTYRADNRKSLGKIVGRSEIAEEIKKSQIHVDADGNLTRGTRVEIGGLNSIISQELGTDKVWVSSYELNAEGIPVSTPKMVKQKYLDLTNQVEHITRMGELFARHTGLGASEQYIRNAVSQSIMPMVSKNLIPLTTNVVKKRVFQILGQADKVKNPRAILDFVGDLRHGIVGIAQDVIDIGKHGDTQQAARYSMVLDWLVNPVGNERGRLEAKELFMSKFADYAEAPPQDYLNDVFDLYSGRIESYERLTRSHQQFRTYNHQMLDIQMGRRNSSVLDIIRMSLGNEFDDAGLIEKSSRSASFGRETGESLGKILSHGADGGATFRKAGKWGAIGAAAFLAASLFTPFGDTKSLNPLDMFVDLGIGNDGQPNAIRSDLELPGRVPLNMVDASFSKQAYIRMNNPNRTEKRDRSIIMNNLLANSMFDRSSHVYEFRSRPNLRYSNYTSNINSLGSSELDRRSKIL